MNTLRMFIYWLLLVGLLLAYLIRHSRILTRLCMNASIYIWPDFYKGLRSYAIRSTNGMTRIEFKYKYRHEMAGIIDVSNGFNIEWFSSELVKFIGYEPDELNSLEQVAGLIYPDDCKQFAANIQQRLKDKEVGTAKYRVITKYGDLRWISLSSWVSNGYIFSVARDITGQEIIKQYLN